MDRPVLGGRAVKVSTCKTAATKVVAAFVADYGAEWLKAAAKIVDDQAHCSRP